jgi:predicted anti-sigma-YlaC factor YlaD
MSCSSAEALFERFLDGELTAAQHAGVLAHVDGCTGCRCVFDELRQVDALLCEPRQVELSANFTSATMAEARAFGPPVPPHAPLRAYLASYLAGAWLLAGAAVLLAPQVVHAAAGTLVEVARSAADVAGGLGAVVARLFGRGGNVLAALLAALLALDALLVVGCGLALRFVRPRLVERLRS